MGGNKVAHKTRFGNILLATACMASEMWMNGNQKHNNGSDGSYWYARYSGEEMKKINKRRARKKFAKLWNKR